MEAETMFVMAWHLTRLAQILRAEVDKEAKKLPPPRPLLESMDKHNADLERRKEAEYATEINTALYGDNLERLLQQSLDEAKRKKRETDGQS